MAGFLNALSVLAPVAPALSDAQDIRAQRAQQAQEAALRDAQLTTQKLADEGERQRQTQLAQPKFIGDPQWNPLKLSMQGVTLDPSTGALALKDVPGGVDPIARAKAIISEREQTTGEKLSPEEKANIYDQAQGYKPLATKITPLTGAAGQPQEYPKGSGNYVTFGRDASGAVVAQPMPAGYIPPTPKPASPAVQFTNLTAKQILANQKKGPPLTPEEAASLIAASRELTLAGISTATARAVENAKYGVTNVTDDTGEDVAQTRLNVVNAANSGTPYASAVVGSPTGMDKKNQVLAQSAIQQVNRMESILARDPKLTGPGAGQLTAMQTWLGTQDPDAQAFLMSSLLGSEHGVAVFGGRNVHTIQDLQNTLGAWKTNPAALKSALEVIRETMTPWATAAGRLPGPRVPGIANPSGGVGSGQFVVIDPRGKPHRFETQAQADNFRTLIKPK